MKFVLAIFWVIIILFCDKYSKKIPIKYKYEFGYWVGAISMCLLDIIL